MSQISPVFSEFKVLADLWKIYSTMFDYQLVRRNILLSDAENSYS